MRAGRTAGIVGTLAALAVVAGGPRASVDGSWSVPELPADLEAHLRRAEAGVPDLRPGGGKRILRTGPQERTPLAIGYLHGFTADPHEVEPLVSELSEALGAHAYFARLAGHGRAPEAMADVRATDWMQDAAETVAVARRLGERVVLVGTSTGATLAVWAALQPELARDVAALVLLSPNFGPADPRSGILLWPWGGLIARLVEGRERCFPTHGPLHERHWTECHPTSVLLPMMALVAHVRGAPLERIRVPVLVAYSPEDRVVDPERIRAAHARFGSAEKELWAVPDVGDPDRHVLAGDALSPGTTELVLERIVRFLERTGIAESPGRDPH